MSVRDRLLAGVLCCNGVLISLLAMSFLDVYVGSVPVPWSAPVAGLMLAWMTLELARLDDDSVLTFGAQIAFFLTLLVGLFSPTDDSVMTFDWRILFLLVCAGLIPAAAMQFRRIRSLGND